MSVWKVRHLNATWCNHEEVNFALREIDTMFEIMIRTQGERLRLLWLWLKIFGVIRNVKMDMTRPLAVMLHYK